MFILRPISLRHQCRKLYKLIPICFNCIDKFIFPKNYQLVRRMNIRFRLDCILNKPNGWINSLLIDRPINQWNPSHIVLVGHSNQKAITFCQGLVTIQKTLSSDWADLTKSSKFKNFFSHFAILQKPENTCKEVIA